MQALAKKKKRNNKPDFTKWGKNIKESLKIYGLKQSALARHCEISDAKMSLILNGKTVPDHKILKGIEDYLSGFNWINQRLQIVVPDNVMEVDLIDSDGRSLGTLDLTSDCVALIRQVRRRKIKQGR